MWFSPSPVSTIHWKSFDSLYRLCFSLSVSPLPVGIVRMIYN
jgi:hypothetical protein